MNRPKQTFVRLKISSFERWPLPSLSQMRMKRLTRSSSVFALIMTIKSRNSCQLRYPEKLKSMISNISFASSSGYMKI
jgi:hypothetical protein